MQVNTQCIYNKTKQQQKNYKALSNYMKAFKQLSVG